MNKPAIVTLKMLEDHRACRWGVNLFKKLFPTGEALVTRESVFNAINAGLDIDWGARHFLKNEYLKNYTKEMEVPTRLLHEAMIRPFKTYKTTIATLAAEGMLTKGGGPEWARMVYRTSMAGPIYAYKTARCNAFADNFISQCEKD